MLYRYFCDNPKYLWLVFYLFLNLVYTGLIISNQTLYSEAGAIPVDGAVPVITIFLLLAASYIFFQAFWFNLINKIRMPKIGIGEPGVLDRRVSFTLLALQVLFLGYALSSGSYVANSTAQGGSLLSQVWVLIPVDVLSFLYYGFYRDSRYFKLNCAAWVVSSLLRGWSGILLTIVFFETGRLIRARAIRAWHVLSLLVLLVVGYPIVYFGKLLIRFYAAQPDADFSPFWSLYQSIDLGDAVTIAFQQVFDRLQLISSSVAVYQLAPALRVDYYNGLIQPFWLEGLHGLVLGRVLGIPDKLDLGQSLGLQLDPLSIINWNANPTMVGWFFILPQYAIFNFVYAILLGTAFVLLGRMLKQTRESQDMMWYAWLILIIPGWYGAMFLYVYVMALFVGLHAVLGYRKRSG